MAHKGLWQHYPRPLPNGYYIVAIQYPHTLVYELLGRSCNATYGSHWNGFESTIAKIIAFIPLHDVLVALCGADRPNTDATHQQQHPLKWHTGELPKTGPLLVSTPIELDVVEWYGEDLGWPSYIHHVEGYILLHELLLSVARYLHYNP